ncbi:extracellular solute-binding protein [Streptomyces sp. SPB074]|uniref:extracellular solute-binding protein n=1 Tax=Streptomyces sp. (strain SPB074) TaxID=465543 RepID=UPI00017F1CD5|nr:extracellular solute-binding protein [Streptomyces sp. SPB074]EDY43750.1 ABC-type sugar transport system periplasmic component [Streptomyces sp. SPB074]
MTTSLPSRRSLLKGAALAAVAGTALPSLAACSSGPGGGTAGPAPRKAVPMPTYVEPVKPAPDLPGTKQGVMDVYKSFPLNGPASVKGPAGDGQDFDVLLMTYGQPTPPLSKSAYWQLLNKELNVHIKPTIVPAADFEQKFPALVAGGDLPDVVSVPMYVNVSRLPQLAQAQFTDLSDHLSGDAVKKYPNLAGIQESAWANGYLNGRIYGVPKSDPVFGSMIYTKTDVIEKAGADPAPKNLAEFTTLAKQVTDARRGVYAFGGGATVMLRDTMLMAFGVPNKWTRKKDGSFVSMYEHPAFIDAVDAIGKLWKAGYYHPDSPTMNKTQHDALFRSGKLVLLEEGNRSVGLVADDSKVVFGMMTPFAQDGGKPVYWENSGAYAITMLRRTGSKKKVDQFLRVLDYLAAPFGTKESFVVNYGEKGTDYEMKDGIPVLTTRGQREQDLGLAYIVGGPQTLCYPQGAPGVDRMNHAWQSKVVPMLLKDPAAHLHSNTKNTKGASLDQHMQDAIKAVAYGRSPASSLKSAVAAYKRGGGDAMARDYAKAAEATA